MTNREMKDSGVEWIGEIPRGWEITKLKNIIEFKNGYAFKSSDLNNSKIGYPVVRIGDFNNNGINIEGVNYADVSFKDLENYLIQNNDILIAMSGGTVGKLSMVDNMKEDYYINQRVGIIRSKYSKLIYYYLNSGEFLKYVLLESEGSAQPNISSEDIKNFPFPTIPFDEQQKIASFLDKKVAHIDSIIEDTKQSIENLKAYKQSLITETVTKGLDPNVEMKDSGIEWLGKIPNKWSIGKLKYISKIKRGASPRPIVEFLTSSQEGYNWIKIGDTIPGEKYINKTSQKITKNGAEKSVEIFPGDLVMSNSMSIGRPYISNINGYIHDGWLAFNFDDETINSEWLYYMLTASIDSLKQLSQGTTVNNLNIERVQSLTIPFYSIREQSHIVSYLNEKIQSIDKINIEKERLISSLQSYKKSLIYEYVTGKKEVK